MYYVPDGTMMCGFYECKNCDSRFLHLRIVPRMICPYCGEAPDMEIGPDEELPEVKEDAVLLKAVEGEDEVVKYDGLLALAFTTDDESWL